MVARFYAGWDSANRDKVTRSTLFDKVAFYYTTCANPQDTGSTGYRESGPP